MILLLLAFVFLAGLLLLGHTGVIAAVLFLRLSSAAMFGANTMILSVLPMSYTKYGMVASVAGFLDFCSYITAGAALVVTGIFVDYWDWNGVLVFWMIVSLFGIESLFISYKKHILSE